MNGLTLLLGFGVVCFVVVALWMGWVLLRDWRRRREERLRWSFDPIRALRRPIQIKLQVEHTEIAPTGLVPRR